MKKILLVEDDPTIHSLINELLTSKDYEVLNAYTGNESLKILKNKNIDLILLDLMLPDISGEEIIKEVKNTPIIVISAKSALDDKVNNLLNGANDYITKPFDNDELLARIEVQLRDKLNAKFEYKDLKLLDDNHTLLLNNINIYLTKTEYIIMKCLLLNPNKVITKTKLLEEICINNENCDENSLKVHISNIRKKIKNVKNKDYIESVWGIGFKININL